MPDTVPPEVGGRPFYDARADPGGGTAAWTLDDLCDFAAAAGDPYGACYIGTSMLAQNPPQHTRQRRAVSKPFTAKAVEAMRDQVVAKVNGLLDEVTAGAARSSSLANEVAYRIPISVVCGMFGVPAEHHDRFRSLIEENAAVVEPIPTPEQVAMADRARGELMDRPGSPPSAASNPATTSCRSSSPSRAKTAA